MDRRRFLQTVTAMGMALATRRGLAGTAGSSGGESGKTTLFLGGDAITGRGIDAILPHSSEPLLPDDDPDSARYYLRGAEEVSGPIPRNVEFNYIWGDALEVFDQEAPDFRLANLETCVTTSNDRWPDKRFNFRMHPDNMPVLKAAGIDCVSLANNHVCDFSEPGLLETLEVVGRAGIGTAGAGTNLDEAEAPAVFELAGGGALRVYSCADSLSGTPDAWSAEPGRFGVNHVGWLDPLATRRVEDRIRAEKNERDLVVASVHFGGNWGYEIPRERRLFARRLVEAGADVVYGHSSHHPLGIEVYQGKPLIYGTGDLIHDFEGRVSNNVKFRGDLTLLHFATIDIAARRLEKLRMYPMRIKRYRLQHASKEEAQWLREMLVREGETLGTGVVESTGALELRWL